MIFIIVHFLMALLYLKISGGWRKIRELEREV
jgi:hypothetical protein